MPSTYSYAGDWMPQGIAARAYNRRAAVKNPTHAKNKTTRSLTCNEKLDILERRPVRCRSKVRALRIMDWL
jgi:hypothetical protein